LAPPPVVTEEEPEVLPKEAETEVQQGRQPEFHTTPPEEPLEAPARPLFRLILVVFFPLMAAATMAGGVFLGFTPRIQAAISGVLGIVVAVLASRVRLLVLAHAVVVVSILTVGLLMVLSTGFGNLADLTAHLKTAASSGDLLRPPVPYDPGWAAILGWIMAGLGFAAAWAAIEVGRPALGTLIPLLIVGFAAISVPKDQQLASGLVAIALFAVGLGLLSTVGEGEGSSLAYEVRRGIRALPLIAAVLVALYFLAQSGFLFPDPLIDPLEEAQRPKPIPLSKATDRVLFTVQSSITGPWRMGHLDVYEQKDSSWRLPPFAENRLKEVPESGIVDRQLEPGFKATFDLRGLGGAVLPGLPNTTGIVAQDVNLAYDSRTGTIRVAQGQVLPGIKYVVTGGKLPTVEELQRITSKPPKSVQRFLRIPPPPPAVEALLSQAPQTSAWDRMDFLRLKLLGTVVAEGAGNPVSVSPAKVQDMLAGSKKGTPFEIVAGQAMLARWAGVPSRIAYGFDGGEKIGEDTYEVRPRHGATFLEVYFPGSKWLPVIGDPQQAKSSLSETEQLESNQVLPGGDISIQLFFPLVLPPEGDTLDQIRQVLLTFVLVVLFMLAVYYLFPALRKSMVRTRRRKWAVGQGPSARIALAYSEWRDFTTDLGYRYPSDTPLMFLDRVIDDEEHAALAWLVTRCLWGDRQFDVTEQDAVYAEELSQSIRKRTGLAHTWTLRFIAALSRLSLRYPYSRALAKVSRVERNGREKKAA
jgi:hypothetical protein